MADGYAGVGAPRGRSSCGSNCVPSLQTANMMPASLRASATTAVALPRRCAIRAHHSCSAFVLSVFHRGSDQAASTTGERARALPALLILPRRWMSKPATDYPAAGGAVHKR